MLADTRNTMLNAASKQRVNRSLLCNTWPWACHARGRFVTKAMFGDFRNVKTTVVIPDQLVGTTFGTRAECNGIKLTVYTVRVLTSYRRGSALSDPYASVSLCMIGKDGKGILKAIPPVADVADAADELTRICSIVDQSAGANCELATGPDAAWRRAQATPPAKLRFQEGHVDEFSFLGPDLGALSALYIAPERGSWVLDEVDVSSSRTAHIDRFVCGRRLGEGAYDSAACLTPVPPGAVVYGTGDSAVVLTKEQANAMRAAGNQEYGALKSRLLNATAALAAGGSGIMAIVGGVDVAVPFAFGGAAGVLYQWLLQQTTDSLAADLNLQVPRLGGGLLSSRSTRLALLGAVALVGLCAVQEPRSVEAVAHGGVMLGAGALGARQVMAGLAGFMMYKAALVSVGWAPSPPVVVPAAQEAKQQS